MWGGALPASATPAAGAGARAGARAIDAAVELVLIAAVFMLGPDDRPLAKAFIALLVVAAYEAAFVAVAAATPGKLATGIRVTELDRPGGGVDGATAVRRGLGVSASILTIVPAVAEALSITLAPLRRGVLDRASRTFVVRAGTGAVTSNDLAGYEVRDRPPVWTAHGPAVGVARRARGRASRLDDAPFLVVALIAMLAALQLGGIGVLLAVSALWLVVFIVDETWRIARFGATAGHRRAGLVVVDRRSGEPPGLGRSLLRALVLAPLLYIPPLQGVLALWVTVSDTHRGPHDLAGRTVVVDHTVPRPAWS
ncbi:hypothetical protein BH20ACT2_BH20ACT2_00580 [soil metagenome]